MALPLYGVSAGVVVKREQPMRRSIIALLPTAAAFGSLFPGVGPLFAFRLMVLLLGLLALRHRRAATAGLATVGRFRLLIVLWTFVAFIGSFFVPTPDAAWRALPSVVLGLVLGYTFVTFRDSKEILPILQCGWVLAFLATSAVAVREVATGVHLSNYFPSTELVAVDPRLVASVFGNPNNYAAFLVTAFAFLVNGLMASQRRLSRYFYVALVLTAPVLLLYTGSRLSQFALVLEAAVFIGYATRRHWQTLVSAAVIALLSFSILGAKVTDSLVPTLPGKLQTATPSKVASELLGGGSESSGGQRLNLYKNGLWMVANSAGLGVGPGQFEVVIASGSAPHRTGGVLSPHNAYLEVASQYGIVVLFGFLFWMAACVRWCWAGARRAEGELRFWGIVMIAAIAGNSVTALATSAYLPSSVNWTFLATLLLVAVTIERHAKLGTPPSPTINQNTHYSVSRHGAGPGNGS